MYKRVLLPLDGSTMAEQALPHAVEQARRCRSELILLRAIGRFPHTRGEPTMELGWVQDQADEWAREYMECIATQVRTQGVRVTVVVKRDPPHEAITQFAESNDVDLIVICSRGFSGPSRWLMGSVADRVVRGATVPVLLVRASDRKDNSEPRRASSPGRSRADQAA